MEDNLKSRVLKKLEGAGNLSRFHVVLLPDLFLDHILRFEDFDSSIERFSMIYNRGGGNLRVERQMLTVGGNAANTAVALAGFGISSHLIAETDEMGLSLLREFLSGVDISRVRSDGELSTTVALEFDGRNIMLSYAGSLSDFSFDNLYSDDLNLIASSDIVCVTNWTLNKKGTELAEKVFSFAKDKGVKTFFDIGDPSSRKKDSEVLIEKVLSGDIVDILSLNENELLQISSYFGVKDENLRETARRLQEILSPRLDLHTRNFSLSREVLVPSIGINRAEVSTGAGDAWNAGDIIGELLGFKDDERLFLANATASCYISDPLHRPTIKRLKEFLIKK